MKKIIVNDEACIGCGACVSIDPEHFEFNDEGLSHTTNNENLESTDLASAISSCPTSAISIEEVEETANQEENNDACDCENCHCTNSDTCGCHHEEE